MKFDEITPQPAPEILDEVKMSSSVYDSFLTSSAAENIRAGFEAELCFKDAAPNGTDTEREEDLAGDVRPTSINQVVNFFDAGDNSSRQLERLEAAMLETYYEWRNGQLDAEWERDSEKIVREYIEENEFDMTSAIEEYLTDTLELSPEEIEAAQAWERLSRRFNSSKEERSTRGSDPSYAHYAEARDAANEQLDEVVERVLKRHGRIYDGAREEWEEDSRDYDQQEWLSDEVRWMSDVPSRFDGVVEWPYWTEEGGFADGANDLAETMKSALNVNVAVSTEYHNEERRPGLWIFEPDSSLEADDDGDLPVEIISPPLPIAECLEILPRFWAWAASEDAYSNESTGFHVGVSLPGIGGRVDYLKLALFLGDQHVLDQFDRAANTYTASALKKIKRDVKAGNGDAVNIVLDDMKRGLTELAATTLKQTTGHGKYTSINIKREYIEFRSMGGERYFTDPDSLNRVIDTVKRYAYAMYIASKPELFRQEYATKLYKLLDKSDDNSRAMQEFSQYVTAVGGASAETVKSFIRSLGGSKGGPVPLPGRRGDGWLPAKTAEPAEPAEPATSSASGRWAILSNGQQVFAVTAPNHASAVRLATIWLANRSPEYHQEHADDHIEIVPLTA